MTPPELTLQHFDRRFDCISPIIVDLSAIYQQKYYYNDEIAGFNHFIYLFLTLLYHT